MAQIKIAEIKDSLIEQLTLKGANIEVYRDLIDSYIFAQNLNEKCKQIYAKRLNIQSYQCHRQRVYEGQPIGKNAVMYNKQRLAILSQMGLSIDKVESESDDEL